MPHCKMVTGCLLPEDFAASHGRDFLGGSLPQFRNWLLVRSTVLSI